MQLDNLSLAYLIEELRPTLDGAYVNKVSQTDNGWLKIKLHSKKGSKDLIIAKNNFFISNYSISWFPRKHTISTAWLNSNF